MRSILPQITPPPHTMNIKEAKDRVCQERFNATYCQAIRFSPIYKIKEMIDESMKLYASEKVKEALQLAAERTNYPYRDEYGCMCDVPAIVLGLETELIEQINKESHA